MSSSPTPSDPYSTITVSEVSFTGNTGPVQAEAVPPFAYGPGLDPDNFSTDVDAFVVGIHAVDPPIGSGDPQSRDSLIGFKILATGEYTDIEVPIFPYRPDIRPGQVFPPTPDGTTEIEGTLWHDIGSDYGATQGVIRIDGSINASADITDLDQNPNRYPIGLAPSDPVWNFFGGRGPDTFDDGDDPRFGESVTAFGTGVAVGAPLEDHSENVGSTYFTTNPFDGGVIAEELEPGVAGIPEIEEGAQFGSSVALGLPLVAVGAPNDEDGRGAVYLFGPDESESPDLKHTISGDSPGDDFGAAVATSTMIPDDIPEEGSDTLPVKVLAGAPNAGTGGKVTAVDIEVTFSDIGSGSGSTFDSLTVTDTDSLSPDGLDSGAEFGSSIATSFDPFVEDAESPVLIGAPGAAPDGTDDAGNAYLYETVSSEGEPTKELTASPPQADDRFGSSVDLGVEEPLEITDDTDPDLFLSVGAPGDSSNQGEAYLFEIEDFFSADATNLEESELSDDEGSPGDELGTAVALTDNQNIVAGAPGGGYATLFDNLTTTFDDSGIAGRFTRPGDMPSFGASVATSFGRVVIGAPDADGGGAAFIYERSDGDGPGGGVVS
jgi:hypothetical protein